MKAIGRIGRFRLPLEIDAEGNARVRGSVGSRPEGRKPPRATDLSHGRPGTDEATRLSGVTAERPTPSPFDSKLEGYRHRHLTVLQLANEVQRFIYHPFTVPLPGGVHYTPDFLVWWSTGRLTVEEVKGSLKQKNARDSVTRLKVFAGLYPMFACFLILKDGRGWDERAIA